MDLVVGRVVKAHGVTGEVVVEIRTDDPDSRFLPGTALRAKPSRGGAERTYVIDSVRQHGGRLLMRLDGVADRDAADALRGTVFLRRLRRSAAHRGSRRVLRPSARGTARADDRGLHVGTVAEVLHTAAGELLAVRAERDGGEVLVPFVSAIVTSVSLADQTDRNRPARGSAGAGR